MDILRIDTETLVSFSGDLSPGASVRRGDLRPSAQIGFQCVKYSTFNLNTPLANKAVRLFEKEMGSDKHFGGYAPCHHSGRWMDR